MPLRIAIATPTPHDRCETFVRSHIERLERVELVLTDGSLPSTDGLGRPLLAMGVVHRMGDRLRGAVDQRERLRRRITALLGKHRIEVVLAEFGNCASEVLPSCQAAGVPLVAYFLGFDAYRNDVVRRYADYRELFQGAAAIVCVSQAIRDHLLVLGAPPEKLAYNSCGVDLARFTTADSASAPPHLLAVGRFVDKKAPHLTILAFAEVHRQRPEARLTMVGDGPLWEACKQLVKALGLEAAVELCGPREPEAIAEMLRRSRAFVQHSLVTSDNDREGTPVAILEAMGAGVPVISTSHGDITELVGPDRGLLCGEGDIQGMAVNMLRLIADPQEAGGMGRAASEYVRTQHRIEDRIASLQAVLERAAKR